MSEYEIVHPKPVDHLQGHVNPNALPQWLVDAAEKQNPSPLGWMAAAYLAGVQIGRMDVCKNQIDGLFGAVLRCSLVADHGGWHTDGSAKWIERELLSNPEPGSR